MADTSDLVVLVCDGQGEIDIEVRNAVCDELLAELRRAAAGREVEQRNEDSGAAPLAVVATWHVPYPYMAEGRVTVRRGGETSIEGPAVSTDSVDQDLTLDGFRQFARALIGTISPL